MQKITLISVHVCFSAMLPTQQKKKIIGVIENNAEKCLNFNISTNVKPYANLR